MQWNRFGTNFLMANTPPEDIFSPLPPAVYSVKVMPMSGEYYLAKLFDKFDLPGKLYGDVSSKAKRVCKSYEDRNVSTGVLFVGEKGSGKSLAAKYICNEMMTKNIPIIVINNPYNNNGFCEFIKKIDQDCVIFIDEFEKLYSREDGDGDNSPRAVGENDGTDSASSQDKLLSLFDGVFSSKKLFMLTANNKYNISSFLLNRPGRVYYMFEYDGISQEFIEEYCQDNLLNKTHINKILAITSLFETFSFDMIQGFVEEMNRFDLTPDEAIDGMNIKKPRHRSSKTFSSEFVYKNGECVKLYDLNPWQYHNTKRPSIDIDVMMNDILIYKLKNDVDNPPQKADPVLFIDTCRLDTVNSIDEHALDNYELIACFLTTDMKQVDGKNGIYNYVNENGCKLTLTKVDMLEQFGFGFLAY